MVDLIEGPTVAKKSSESHGGARKGAGRPSTAKPVKIVKIDQGMAVMAHDIAKAMSLSIAEYFRLRMDAIIRKDYAVVLKGEEPKR